VLVREIGTCHLAARPSRPLPTPPPPKRSNPRRRHIRDFVLVKEIGTGNASTVWYAFCKKTSAPLAIKTYKKRKLSPLNRRQVGETVPGGLRSGRARPPIRRAARAVLLSGSRARRAPATSWRPQAPPPAPHQPRKPPQIPRPLGRP
jgi:hypothetical protein